MRKRRKQRGFVLILALVVLSVAAVFLATAARRSCQKALDASTAQQELQLKWGMISCQAAFLPEAEALLSKNSSADSSAPENADRPRAVLHRGLELGGMKFDLVISDEQAKANANALSTLDSGGLEQTLMELQEGVRRTALVRLRPATIDPRIISRFPRLYDSYDRVFAAHAASELVNLDAGEPTAADRITCWGSGRLNFHRAMPSAVRRMAAGILTETQIDQMRQYVRYNPSCGLEDLARHLKLTDAQAAKVRDVLTDTSGCHGLWIIAASPSRSWYRLCVDSTGDGQNDAQKQVYQW